MKPDATLTPHRKAKILLPPTYSDGGEGMGRTLLTVALPAMVILWSLVGAFLPTAQAQSDDLSFSFAGDFGSNDGFRASLAELRQTESDFAFALGGLSYGGMAEDAWCSEFQESFVNVLVVAGSNETGEDASTGSIDEFARHCRYPLPAPVYGEYGKEYYFDYPFVNPIARFILLSPALQFAGDDGPYDYSRPTGRYYWARGVIDDARAAGIPWVIVGMHRNCIAAVDARCEIGMDLFNLLLDRKVDLVLQAGTPHYERSKQLGLSEECRSIVAGRFDPDCIVDDGADGAYGRGAGSVVVLAGTGGREIAPINASSPYVEYQAASAGDSSILGNGVVTFHVARDRITMETHFDGTYRDAMTLRDQPPVTFVQTIAQALPFIAPGAVAIEVLALAAGAAHLSRKASRRRQPASPPKGRPAAPRGSPQRRAPRSRP